MKDLRLAMVQMRSVVGSTDDNFKAMKKYIDFAVEKKGNVICFPEASLTGYSTSYTESDTLSLDCSYINELKNISLVKNITIVFGFMEKSSPSIYMTQAVVCPKEIMLYRKTHLGSREEGRFTRGDEIPVIATEEAILGVQLCWESHIPDISTVLRNKGAELILVPHASNLAGSKRKEVWMKYLVARAYDNSVYVAACNAIGDNARGSVFGGGILVLDRKGNIICEDFNGEESIIFVDLKAYSHTEDEGNRMSDVRYFKRRRPELYRL
ncbi:MAG TPA: nitrilase-related carbon-nitrogen hydrolase [Mobilitalea sp.]|nr:nitrilase-related carbon-nitrogen hydrolase [Mobilitalea sp.]